MLKVIVGVLVGAFLVIVLLVGGCSLLLGKAALDVQKSNQIASAYASQMDIEKGWKSERNGDWMYVRGRVKNGGDRPVRYWKITAKFLDEAGATLDSDIDNSGELLRPGESKSFEIMHRYSSAYKSVSVAVDEVRLE